MADKTSRLALTLLLLLPALAWGCDGSDDGAAGSGRGPVGTFLFWAGEDLEPVVMDSRSGTMARGGNYPRYALQLSDDGWGAAYTEKAHLRVYRILGDGLWEEAGKLGLWAKYAIFSPDNRGLIGVSKPGFQNGEKEIIYGRFNEDGSLQEQVKLDGIVGQVLLGEGGVAWSPDNEHFVVTLDEGLALYHKGERIWLLPRQHQNGLEWLRTASFSPDGQWLAIAVYDWPKLAILPIHRGFLLYNVPARTFLRYLGAEQTDQAAMLDMGEDYLAAVGDPLDAPVWTYDGRGLILNSKRLMVANSSNSCGNINPVPIQVLRIPESFIQGQPVIDDLSVLVPDERLGDYCLRWHHLGSLPENDAELFGFEYREKRYFGRAAPGVANSAYVVINLYFVEVPLDGSPATEIGYFDNDEQSSGAPFGVRIYPFPDYHLRCRSGQTGELFFRNGIRLDLEEGIAWGGQAALDKIILSGDCNCTLSQSWDAGVEGFDIVDLKGNPVTRFNLDTELIKTNYFTPYDWR